MSDDFDWTPFEGDRWNPEEIGDELVGRVIAIRVETGQQGQPVPVVTIAPKDGGPEKEVWASPVDLSRKLGDAKPQVGDLLALRLEEKRHTGKPSPMKIFGVKMQAGDRKGEVTALEGEGELI